ncbi:MAG: nucleotidyltransferase family protein, partial [Anaerolineales bacterium]|nr:nucleotidyltransferase family protein [Anaerolineales bacterium]
DHDTVSEVFQDQPVHVVCNTNWQKGQSTSVQAGIQALTDDVGGAVFLLVDQPLIPPDLVQTLIKTHNRNPAPIILPTIDGKPGNPVFFDRQVFTSLTRLEGDIGGRALFETYPPRKIPWDDGSCQMDIDTPEDYQRIRFSEE